MDVRSGPFRRDRSRAGSGPRASSSRLASQPAACSRGLCGGRLSLRRGAALPTVWCVRLLGGDLAINPQHPGCFHTAGAAPISASAMLPLRACVPSPLGPLSGPHPSPPATPYSFPWSCFFPSCFKASTPGSLLWPASRPSAHLPGGPSGTLRHNPGPLRVALRPCLHLSPARAGSTPGQLDPPAHRAHKGPGAVQQRGPLGGPQPWEGAGE